MHCSSCIWLLENLSKLDGGVLESRVNFPRREISISYSPQKTTLGNLVTLLHKIGYGPTLNLSSLNGKKEKKDHSIHLKLGLAAFCSGNTMLLAFPILLRLRRSNIGRIRFFLRLSEYSAGFAGLVLQRTRLL